MHDGHGEGPGVIAQFKDAARVRLAHEPVRFAERGGERGKFVCRLDGVGINEVIRRGAEDGVQFGSVRGVHRAGERGDSFFGSGEGLSGLGSVDLRGSEQRQGEAERAAGSGNRV